MPFNIIGFLAGRAVAENAGVDRQRATQLAILPGALNLPLPVGLVTARAIAQREAPTVTTPPVDTGQDNQITVPDLTGQLAADAVKILSDRGLTDVKVGPVPSSPADKGRIVGQSYAPNTNIAKDTPIILYVGQGAPPVKVPEVIGFSFDVASQILADQGLEFRITRYVPDASPRDFVVAQQPDPGQPAPGNKLIELTLSLGPAEGEEVDTVEVPNVISMHAETAMETIREKGMEPEVVAVEPNKQHKDHVFDQKPPPFEKVQPGTKVELAVSLGPEGPD